MSLNPVGQAADIGSIRNMADRLSDILGDRINPASIMLRPADQMPRRSDGGPAFGFWRAGTERRILLWDEIEEYPVEKTLAHEAMHVVNTDWLTPSQKADIIQLMSPTPTSWNDEFIGGERKKYVALPFESFAVYASAAIVGFERPAYRTLFVRRIPDDKWPKLRQITLRDDDTESRGSGDIENIPVPPDPLDDLVQQLAEAQAQLTAAIGAREAAEIAQALADGKLSQAKTRASEIRSALGAGDTLRAMEKVAEIESL